MTASSPCKSRTSPSTTSAAIWPTKYIPSARSPSPRLLKDEGFARLPRRADDERPPGSRPTTADVADVRRLDLSPRSFETQFGGLFLFLPMLASIPLDRILQAAGFPGSEMIPPGCALRSLLALKLFGTARHRHVTPAHVERGSGRGTGPLRRTERHPQAIVLDRIQLPDRPGLLPGADAPLVRRREPARSAPWSFLRPGLPHDPFPWRRCPDREALRLQAKSAHEKGILAFLVQDADTRVFCYANGELRKDQQNAEILRFVQFWKDRTGRYPQELIFDSKLTTYAKLSELNRLGIRFITSRSALERIDAGTRPDARLRVAPDRAEGCLAPVQPSANPRSPDHFACTLWPSEMPAGYRSRPSAQCLSPRSNQASCAWPGHDSSRVLLDDRLGALLRFMVEPNLTQVIRRQMEEVEATNCGPISADASEISLDPRRDHSVF